MPTSDSVFFVKFNEREIMRVNRAELPVERKVSIQLSEGSSIEFRDSRATVQRHDLSGLGGWLHLSVTLHASLAVQADGILTETQELNLENFKNGLDRAIRFQPLFIEESSAKSEALAGRGLFARGLHFNGIVTPANVMLSCLCDSCRKSFRLNSYHAGFSEMAYFYSASGNDTLFVSKSSPGAPAPLQAPDSDSLKALEARLPLAPDQTSFNYLNPFRCPSCHAPYIDFQKYPEMRANEYYANCFSDREPIVLKEISG